VHVFDATMFIPKLPDEKSFGADPGAVMLLPQADTKNNQGIQGFLITVIPVMAGRQALPFYSIERALAPVAFVEDLVLNARMRNAFKQGDHICVEYEMLLNQFFRGVRAMGMCQYDAGRLPPDLVDHSLCAHSSVAIDGRHIANPHYSPALVLARRTAASAVELQNKVDALRRLA